MILKECVYRVLVISSSASFRTSLTPLLPESVFNSVRYVSSISTAKRAVADTAYDFIIISTPLPDDQGIRFAIDASTNKNAIVLFLVKSDIHDEIYTKVAPHGVFTLPKPTSRSIMERALAWMVSAREGLRRFEKKTTSIQQKMEDIRLINHAKWILISHENMSESDAHRHIEKAAMDRCKSRREIAEEIISNNENT